MYIKKYFLLKTLKTLKLQKPIGYTLAPFRSVQVQYLLMTLKMALKKVIKKYFLIFLFFNTPTCA